MEDLCLDDLDVNSFDAGDASAADADVQGAAWTMTDDTTICRC